MNRMEIAGRPGNTEDDVEHIHLPPPSWAPIVLALGLTGVCFGAVLSTVVLITGVVLVFIGLGMWVFDEIRNASREDAEDHSSQSAS